ncbi:protein rep, partial [Enterococcus thailandicus]|uniref:protein rep n=3 Tax=Lactobacillales TaxID=186826 RepID=UPI0022EBA937
MSKNQDIITEKYEPKKIKNLELIQFMFDKISEKGIERMRECSTFNQFVATEDKIKKKMVASNPCKNRFCPICTYRKARKDGLMLSVLMKAIQEEKNQEFLFLTLTTPNVKADELKVEIDRFNHAFHKLFRRKQIKKSIKGYVRKLELTYNKERD